MNIFDIPEVAVRIFPFLSTVDRAHSRLITTTFDSIYKIEEKNDLIVKWQKYCQELADDYESPVLNNEQLEQLINMFTFTNMQFHLKVWLTNCASGKHHFSYLIAIAPVDEWEFVSETPISTFSTLSILNSEFGENQWQDNLILVHRNINYTLLDKRNGFFYIMTCDYLYPSLKCIGHIKDWIESIPLHVIKPQSLFGSNYLIEEFVNNIKKYVKIMQEGDKQELIEFLSVQADFYPNLCDELKRDPEILDAVKKCFENDPDGYFGIDCIPATFPTSIRKDKDAYFDLFTIRGAHAALHHSLRKDKDFTIKLMTQYANEIDTTQVQADFVNDPEIAKHWTYDFRLKESGFKIKTKEDILKFLQITLDIELVDEDLLNNLPLMVEIINQHFERSFKVEYLEDREEIIQEISKRNIIFLSIASPKLRNDREFMLECIEINVNCAYFIGDSLKHDVKLLANPIALGHVRGLNLTKDEIIEIFSQMDDDDIDYAMDYNVVKNYIPTEYLQDSEFILQLLGFSAHTNVLISKDLRKDYTFWKRAIEVNPRLLQYGVVPIKILREDYQDLSSIDYRLWTDKMRDDKTVIENSIDCYAYASERIRSDKKLLLTNMESNSKNFLFAPKHLQEDPEVIQALGKPYVISIPNKLPSRFSKQQ